MRVVTFADTWSLVKEAIREAHLLPEEVLEVWVIRDLTGRVSLLLPEGGNPGPLQRLAEILYAELGAHAYPLEEAIVTVSLEDLEWLRPDSLQYTEQGVRIFQVDRELTSRRWATISDLPGPPRFVFYALKGGLGRSTTAAVLTAHLARQGHRVLVVDFDLESPALASLLAPAEQPDFGIVEWLVEDLVGQSDRILPEMIGRPGWSVDFQGEVLVVPAYGRKCTEHLAQLGRAYLDRPPERLGTAGEKWIERVRRLVRSLETEVKPTLVILDSRNGLHDIAAALMTGLQAQVLLFAVDSEPTWNGYRILFRHWHLWDVVRSLRERLSLVAAMVPLEGRESYLQQFRQHAWDLFQEYLYDEVPPVPLDQEFFSFDLSDEDAPHNPLPVYWNRGLLAWPDLRSLDEGAVRAAYGEFLERFEQLLS